MSSFLDLCRVLGRDTVKSLYYLCGEETLLREQALDMVRAKVAAPVQDTQLLSVLEHSAADIWDAILTHSQSGNRRFVLVRDAEHLRDWEPFWTYIELLRKRQLAPSTVVFVAAQDDFAERVTRCTRGHGPEAIDLIRSARGRHSHQCTECVKIRAKITAMSNAQYVQCSTPTEAAALKLVAGSLDDFWPGWLGCSRPDAARVLDAVSWELKPCWDLCQKIRLTKVRVNDRVLQVLASRPSTDTYVDSLIALQRGTAAGLARALSTEESRRVLGQLERRVDLLAKLHRAMRREESTQALARTLNLNFKLVESLRPYARHYDADRVSRASISLARTDAALQRGAEAGALELLALSW